jgi:short-subunit dehydrogenase
MKTIRPLALITGASSGIGQALAWRFYLGGYRLALLARREEEVQAWILAKGLSASDVQVYKADVAQFSDMALACARCIAQQGLPDVVIANAGISVGVDIGDAQDMRILQQHLQTNVMGLAHTFQPFVHPLQARGSGTLVGIASVAGIRGLPGHAAYCASKAAVISFCESLRGDCRPFGVKVVTLAPGYIDTPLTQKNRYHMPFLMSPSRFADQAFKVIARQSSYAVIPWQMALVAKILRLLPNLWFDRLLSGRPRKHRSQGDTQL